jgi:hypothetical protein
MKGTGEVTSHALDLTRKVVKGFNGDEDALIDFLLLIDIFEQTDDPIYLNAVLGTVRHLAYGMSDRADDQSREFLDSKRKTFAIKDEGEQAH